MGEWGHMGSIYLLILKFLIQVSDYDITISYYYNIIYELVGSLLLRMVGTCFFGEIDILRCSFIGWNRQEGGVNQPSENGSLLQLKHEEIMGIWDDFGGYNL